MEPSLTQAGTEETLSHSNWVKVYIFLGLCLGVVPGCSGKTLAAGIACLVLVVVSIVPE
jgi:hypothetical protein